MRTNEYLLKGMRVWYVNVLVLPSKKIGIVMLPKRCDNPEHEQHIRY